MSNTMPDSTITIEGFTVRQDDGTTRITYLENNNLTDQLLEGKNIRAEALGGVVLVKLAVDESFNEVEVEGILGRNTQADTIDAAIESLIEVRDILRKGVTLGADLAATV
jgi:hypothetical protein